ncbi:uncharacterized protein (DUF885 family) [Nocardioides zeae]|uniref:Uncharacterized protein (DUF885 family) n=1 Tax=Nocardioides zeae TaxID=1457234 RepID=A0ACC6IGA0_9ACTN|nr:DUF885 domain-containing protein [Nocardioides zeae]MDR6176628.1 uncharacterized protein (DUF885 family) [Nocardioides zeae]MDR6209640.1 uncharacterized protein (DUF885 family) [Nocardioides zeae]
MSRSVDERSERYVADHAAADPVTATGIGVAGHEHELTDYSPEGFDERLRLARAALVDVRAATPVDDREAVARAAFLERVGLRVEHDEAGFTRSEVNVIASPIHELRQVFDLMPTATAEDWEAVDARLAGVPGALAGLRVTLAEEAAHGRVSAARQYAEVATQLERWTGQTGGGSVFADLVGRGVAAGTVPAGLRSSLERGAREATAAFASLGLFLSDEMEPRGRAVEAVGRDHYALASRLFLGATIDLEETYAWGWEELARIEADMRATAARITPDATGPDAIDVAVAHLEGDPARRIEGREPFRAWMQELADRVVGELADVHFDIPEPVRRIECCLAPTNDGGIYYTGPSEDFSRPGRMWWSVPDGIEQFHPWRETTTVFHEGVPGHHLQVGQTAYRSSLLNRWQRTMCWVSGHGEGWALYAERLMDELGYLDDPADRLGMLDAQGFRAARVIVDIGMHLQLEIPADNPFGFHPGERWTPDLGLAFMRQHSRDDDATIRFEVNRYLGWPGQAPSYKVGERIWLEAREAARARHGDAFDLKAFHRSALDLGSLGLDPLVAALARI